MRCTFNVWKLWVWVVLWHSHHVDVQMSVTSMMRYNARIRAVLNRLEVRVVPVALNCAIHGSILESCPMHEFIHLSLGSAESITGSQVAHHSTSTSVASSSHVLIAWSLLRWMSEVLILDASASVPSFVLEHVVRRGHTVLADCTLWVKWNLSVLWWFWSVERICSLMHHVQVYIIICILHVHWDGILIDHLLLFSISDHLRIVVSSESFSLLLDLTGLLERVFCLTSFCLLSLTVYSIFIISSKSELISYWRPWTFFSPDSFFLLVSFTFFFKSSNAAIVDFTLYFISSTALSTA